MTQRPDSTTAKDSGGSFDAHSEGQHPMVCVDVVNLGTNVEQFADDAPREVSKAALVFASGERQKDGTLTIVAAEMTLSMNENANMRKLLESWRGRSYTPEQAQAGVPLDRLYGQTALITVEHITTRRGRQFAKIRSITQLPPKMDGPNSEVLEEYERPKFFETKKAEYAAATARLRDAAYPDQSPTDDDAGAGDGEAFDPNDLPF